jgi:hypothetical protein
MSQPITLGAYLAAPVLIAVLLIAVVVVVLWWDDIRR